MQTASSTRVQTSQTRNSSVGYAWCGRTSHQIFEPSGTQRVVDERVEQLVVLARTSA